VLTTNIDVEKQWEAAERLMFLTNSESECGKLSLSAEDCAFMEQCKCGEADLPQEWIQHFALLIGGKFVIAVRLRPCYCDTLPFKEKRVKIREANEYAKKLAESICKDLDEMNREKCRSFMTFLFGCEIDYDL